MVWLHVGCYWIVTAKFGTWSGYMMCFWIVTAKFGTWSGYMLCANGLSQLSLVHGLVSEQMDYSQ